MTEDRKRREQLTEYVQTVRRFHPMAELKRRFAHRTFDETFSAVGKLADPMLNDLCSIWLGYEILVDAKTLDRDYLL